MKEIGTCKECRWWKEYAWGKGTCKSSGLIDILDDVTWYEGIILTNKDFGCIHWEAKDG